jgi:flagellar assembly factor FliW
MSTTNATSLPGLATSQLHFAAGVPGFRHATTFNLRSWGEEPSPFYVLECQEVVGLCFVAVSPGVFFSWYDPQFGAEVYQALDVAGRDDVNVLVILTLHAKPEDTTANLLGPVVVNARTGEALQAVLSGSGYEPQTPIVNRG